MAIIVNKSDLRYQVDLFKIVEENITLPNGTRTDVSMLRHPGASAIVPLSDSDTMVLVKQYRHSVGRYIWEIPAGTRHPEETPMACAQRGLAEEAGYEARSWHPLGAVTPVPGYSNERVHLFLATDLVPVAQNLDMDEVLEVCEIPVSEVRRMIFSGHIEDCKTICAFYMLEGRLKKKSTPPTHAPQSI